MLILICQNEYIQINAHKRNVYVLSMKKMRLFLLDFNCWIFVEIMTCAQNGQRNHFENLNVYISKLMQM